MTAKLAVGASLMLILLAFLVLFTCLLGTEHAGLTYNSDSIHVFLLIQDMLKDPAALFDWDHSPALYAFPDWIFAAALLLAQVPERALPLVYGTVLLTFYSAAGGALLAASRRVRFLAGTWVTAAALVIAGGAVFLFDRPLSVFAVVTLASPHIHTGAVLLTILSAALLSALLNGRAQTRSTVLLGAVVFASVFSDFIYVPWFVAPACVVAGLHSWSTRTMRGARYALLIGTVSCVAVVAEMSLRGGIAVLGYLKAAGPIVGGPLRAARLLWSQLQSAVAGGDYPLAVVAILVAALFVRAGFLLLSLWRRKTLAEGAYTELLLAGSCAAALLAPLATMTFQASEHWRYFIVVFISPMLWVLHHLFGVSRALRHASAVLGATAASFVVGTSAALAGQAYEVAGRLRAPTPLEVCLAQEGRVAGLGDYWTAKLLMLMSGRRVHMIQLTGRGNALRWDYNRRWFTQRSDTGAKARPDFIIMKNLDPKALRSRFGEPARVIGCANTEVWLYDHPLQVVGLHEFSIGADKLTGAVGRVEGATRTATENDSKQGFLTYGPYLDILKGHYQVTITYSASGPGHRWDAAHLAGTNVLAKGELPDTNGAVTETTFSVDLERPVWGFEVRTWFSGSGTLTVLGLRILKSAG